MSHSKEKPSSAPVLTLWLPEKECQREDLTCDLGAFPFASPEINKASHLLGILMRLVLNMLDARYLMEEFYKVEDIYSREAERGESLC